MHLSQLCDFVNLDTLAIEQPPAKEVGRRLVEATCTAYAFRMLRVVHLVQCTLGYHTVFGNEAVAREADLRF